MPRSWHDLDAPGRAGPRLTQAVACTLPAFLPVILWLVFGPGLSFANLTVAQTEATLLFLTGFLLVPAAVVTCAVTRSALAALNPLEWFRVIASCPLDYVKTTLGVVVLGAAALVVNTQAPAMARAVGAFGGVVLATVGMFLYMAQAALIGGLLLRHAEDFGISLVRPMADN